MPHNDHYFRADGFTPGDAIAAATATEVTLAGHCCEVLTGAGVFSAGHIDHATAVLLRKAPEPPDAGTFVDLGCGWGPLALTMALMRPHATVWALDVNPAALELTAYNAQLLGLQNVRVAHPDSFDSAAPIDLLWSNPPVRIGKEALRSLLATWLPRLAAGGTGWLVVGKNLGADPLAAWLNREVGGLITEKVGSAKGFRVLRVSCTARDEGRATGY